MSKENRLARVWIGLQELRDLICVRLSLKERFLAFLDLGIPKTADLVSIHQTEDHRGIWLVFQDDSFPEVDPGMYIPTLSSYRWSAEVKELKPKNGDKTNK